MAKTKLTKPNKIMYDMEIENDVEFNKWFDGVKDEKINMVKEIEEYDNMKQYKDFINDGLYDESFLLLEENVSKLTSQIDKNKHIRDFIVSLFSDDFFAEDIADDQIGPFAEAFAENFKNKPFLSNMSGKINNFIEQYKITILFVSLVQKNKFDKAEYFLPFINKNMEEIPNTIKGIVENNNIEALRYLCEHMKNINFNNGELLKLVSPMKSPALKMLIEDFEFDINKTSSNKSPEVKNEIIGNLIHHTLLNKQFTNFEYLYSKYGNQIQLNKEAVVYNKKYDVLSLISLSNKEIDLYNVLLKNKDLPKNTVDTITKALFRDDKIVSEAVKSDVYYSLFSHPQYDSQVVNWNQTYFIYGLLAKISSVSYSNSDEAKNYLSVLEAYITASDEEDLPLAKNYHVLGGAIFVANQYQSKSTIDAAIMIIKRYPQYINQPNPDGVLPIDQVDNKSNLYSILINNGAVIPEPPPSFWTGIFKRNKNREQEEVNLVEKEVNENINSNNITKLNSKIIKDFKEISGYIESELCDPTIKFKCENMFLKTKKLLGTIQKHNIEVSYDDIHFLSENFSKYLSKSLSAYITILKAEEEFGVSGANQDNKNNKIIMAKNMCEEHINLLTEQLGLISDNASNYVSMNAEKELKVTTRYLDKKFKP